MILKELTLRIERMTKNKTEYGWVIEHKNSLGYAPKYWSGEINPLSWSDDHLDAIRFSREIDVHRFMNSCFDSENMFHRVSEHGWS